MYVLNTTRLNTFPNVTYCYILFFFNFPVGMKDDIIFSGQFIHSLLSPSKRALLQYISHILRFSVFQTVILSSTQGVRNFIH